LAEREREELVLGLWWGMEHWGVRLVELVGRGTVGCGREVAALEKGG